MKRKQVIKNTYTSRQIFIKKFMKNKLAVVGSLIIIVFVIMAIFAPIFATFDPNTTDLLNIRTSPNKVHILGTDDLGRDIFSRLLYGGRVSIAVGVASMMLQILIGRYDWSNCRLFWWTHRQDYYAYCGYHYVFSIFCHSNRTGSSYWWKYNKFSTHYRNVNVAGYYKNCSRRGSCNEAKRVYSGSESTWI